MESEKSKKLGKRLNLALKILIPLVVIFGIMAIILMVKFPSKKEEDITPALVTIAQKEVKQNLKAPATADFPSAYSEYEFRNNGDVYYVSSYVDSENSFGAKLRSKYVIKFEYYPERKEYKILDIAIE